MLALPTFFLTQKVCVCVQRPRGVKCFNFSGNAYTRTMPRAITCTLLLLVAAQLMVKTMAQLFSDHPSHSCCNGEIFVCITA